MMNVAGNPAPLPEAIPSGTTPPITPSGAAAATTMNTMDSDTEVATQLARWTRWFVPQSIWRYGDFGHG